MNIKDNYKHLTFSNVQNFDLDSFQEKSLEIENSGSNQNPINPSTSGNRKPSSNQEEGNKGLIVVLISLVAIFMLILFFYISSKKREE